MEIKIPTQIIVYVIGIIAVVIVTGGIMGSIMFIERRYTKRKLNEAMREVDADKPESI